MAATQSISARACAPYFAPSYRELAVAGELAAHAAIAAARSAGDPTPIAGLICEAIERGGAYLDGVAIVVAQAVLS